MKTLLISLFILAACSWTMNAQEYRLLDVYKFVSERDSTIIWDFDNKVVRKSWRECDDTTKPLQQQRFIVSAMSVAFEDDEMVVIRFVIGTGLIDVIYSKEIDRYMFIADRTGDEPLFYPISKTIMPKVSKDIIMNELDQKVLKYLKKNHGLETTQMQLDFLNSLTDKVRRVNCLSVYASKRSDFRAEIPHEAEQLQKIEERA